MTQPKLPSLTAIVVDDEPPARQRLMDLLKAEADIQVVAQCVDGVEAIAAIQEHKPDIVFLDVQMPEVSGLDVVRSLGEGSAPAIIFTTAHDRHAVEAFELSAVDYLLKPFKPDRFQRALQKARANLANRTTGATTQRLVKHLQQQEVEQAPSPVKHLLVRTQDRVVLVRTEEIDWIEAAGNYLVLHVEQANHIMRETMTSIESRMPVGKFVRVSRSALVNVDRIKEFQPMPGGNHVVILRDGQKVTMTRALKEVQESLSLS